eukprot:jgi/Botrbrau1/18334/Bobra.0179s0061.1
MESYSDRCLQRILTRPAMRDAIFFLCQVEMHKAHRTRSDACAHMIAMHCRDLERTGHETYLSFTVFEDYILSNLYNL